MADFIFALRLRIACLALNFMIPNMVLVRVMRRNGRVEWDAGLLVSGNRIIPTGLSSLNPKKIDIDEIVDIKICPMCRGLVKDASIGEHCG